MSSGVLSNALDSFKSCGPGVFPYPSSAPWCIHRRSGSCIVQFPNPWITTDKPLGPRLGVFTTLPSGVVSIPKVHPSCPLAIFLFYPSISPGIFEPFFSLGIIFVTSILSFSFPGTLPFLILPRAYPHGPSHQTTATQPSPCRPVPSRRTMVRRGKPTPVGPRASAILTSSTRLATLPGS